MASSKPPRIRNVGEIHQFPDGAFILATQFDDEIRFEVFQADSRVRGSHWRLEPPIQIAVSAVMQHTNNRDWPGPTGTRLNDAPRLFFERVLAAADRPWDQ